MMKVKHFKLIALLAIVALTLSGCNLFSKPTEEDVVYPPGIITPTPIEEEELDEEEMEEEINDEEPADEEPTPEVSVTPVVSATPTEEANEQDPQTEPIAENKIVVSSVSAKMEAGTFVIHVEGTYPDVCTNSKYSWSINGNNVEIDLGARDEGAEMCAASTKPYSGDIKVNYSFKSGEKYVAVVNGMESEPVTID